AEDDFHVRAPRDNAAAPPAGIVHPDGRLLLARWGRRVRRRRDRFRPDLSSYRRAEHRDAEKQSNGVHRPILSRGLRARRLLGEPWTGNFNCQKREVIKTPIAARARRSAFASA